MYESCREELLEVIKEIVRKKKVNAPKHHGTTYDDYERVDNGIYRLNDY